MDIAAEVLKGNRLALSRAITAIENERADATDIMKALYPHTGQGVQKARKDRRHHCRRPHKPLFRRSHTGRPHPYE